MSPSWSKKGWCGGVGHTRPSVFHPLLRVPVSVEEVLPLAPPAALLGVPDRDDRHGLSSPQEAVSSRAVGWRWGWSKVSSGGAGQEAMHQGLRVCLPQWSHTRPSKSGLSSSRVQ